MHRECYKKNTTSFSWRAEQRQEVEVPDPKSLCSLAPPTGNACGLCKDATSTLSSADRWYLMIYVLWGGNAEI